MVLRTIRPIERNVQPLTPLDKSVGRWGLVLSSWGNARQ